MYSADAPHPSLPATTRHDVVVVGAGPAGSATAALLAEAGHDVLLLDRTRFPRTKPCSEYTGPGTEAMLARLDVLDQVGDGLGRRLRGMELHAPNGDRYLVEYRAGGRARSGFSLPRARLDVALLDVARGRGASVWERFRATSLLVEGPVVGGLVGHDADGRVTTVRARLVVGADGRHSLVSRALGLGEPSRWPPRLGLVTHYRGVRWDEDYGQMRVGRHGYVGVAPLGDDLLTVGLVGPMPSGRFGRPDVAFERALAEYPDLQARLARGRRVRPVQGVGPLAHAVRSCGGDGYLLVGDAAGFCDPFTGEGIHRALRGAELAADAADAALRDNPGPARITPEYALARRAAFQAKERLTAVIQICVRAPGLMNYAIARLNRRTELAAQLSNVLGDLAPPATTLRPGFLWALLKP